MLKLNNIKNAEYLGKVIEYKLCMDISKSYTKILTKQDLIDFNEMIPMLSYHKEWLPKEQEYVWHRDLGFARYIRYEDVNDTKTYLFEKVKFNSKHSFIVEASMDCEPFEGTLPSYLVNKNKD